MLVGIAQAAVEGQVGNEFPGNGAEHRLGVRVDRVIALELQRDRGIAQILERRVGRSLVEIEPAQRPVQRVVQQLAVEAHFLREAPVIEIAEAVRNRQRRIIVVVVEVQRVGPVGGDRLQLDVVGQVEVHLARHAPAVELRAAVAARLDQRIAAEGRVGACRAAGRREVAGVVAIAAADEAVVVRHVVRIAADVGIGVVRLQQHAGCIVAVVMRVIGDDVDIEPVRRVIAQLAAHRLIVDLAIASDDAVAAGFRLHAADRRIQRGARRIDAAEIEPLDVTFLLLGDAGQTHEQVGRKLEVGARPQVHPVAAAISAGDITAAVAGRLLGIELDRAADRILAGESALRTAQHLHPVEVEQVEDGAGEGRVIDVVHIEADARLERRIEIVLPDTADRRGERGAEGGALRLQRHVRRLRGDLGDVRLAACFEHRGIDRGDRQRRILEVLFTELRGNDDLVAGLAGVSGSVRAGGLRRGRCGIVLRQRGAGDRHGGERSSQQKGQAHTAASRNG